MSLIKPVPPPYDPLEWVTRPLQERGRLVCESWALQGYGTPPAVYLFYAAKVALLIGGWMWFCGHSPALTGDIAAWWLHPIAFQKAIVWSMLFEVLGLGCGSGPLTGRYLPPIAGFLHFLRPGTTKLPPWPRIPLLGGHRRGVPEVLLYLGLLIACVHALLAAQPGLEHFLPLVVLVPVLGLLDRTIFLAARAEHYWVTLLCFVCMPQWIAGAMAVQLALWFWAGFSKLNHHFPAVVCVMVSNGPFTRMQWLRRAMYRYYPRDLRPSTLATMLAHAGTALELAVPLAFLAVPFGLPPALAMGLMVLLHGFITGSVPMGVPIEWNIMVVYGAFALFWAHPDVTLAAASPPWFAVLLAVLLIGVPLAGNLWPGRVSFLLAMRYYAGNWATSVWLFRGDTQRKLDRLRKSNGSIYEQLAPFYDRPTMVALVGKVMGFRLMHLHGRAYPELVTRAVDRFEDYEWVDGELMAGLVLGYNFGDGHLHQEQLLAAVQAQCGFEPGELRCVFLESQPLGRPSFEYRIVDASTGPLASGQVVVAELRTRQPWALPEAPDSAVMRPDRPAAP